VAAVAAAVMLAVVVGCGSRPTETVRLYAGAGLRPAVDELVEAFRAETGIEVLPDYDGSGVVITRAREDNDADLFMPGDVWYVDELHRRTGRVVSKTQVSWFVPVLIVAKGNPKGIRSLEDLFRDDVKVALGNAQACQVGRISTKILKKSGLDRATLKDVKEADTVNLLGVWVKVREVDVAIVWDAIAANVADDVDVIEIPRDRNIISSVVVALLNTSKNPGAAQQFIDFMTGPTGRDILRKRGYRVEPPDQPAS